MTHARLRLPLLLACVLLAAGCDRGGDAPAKRAQDVAKRDVRADGAPAGKPAHAMPALPTVAPADVPAALERADAALARGQIERGDGAEYGALEWYRAVQAAAPDDAHAAEGIVRSVEALFERGRIAMRVGALDEASRIEALASRLARGHRDLEQYQRHLGSAMAAQSAVDAGEAAARAQRFSPRRDDAAPAAFRRALGLFPGYRPALEARDRWIDERVGKAWAAAEADRYDEAALRLQDAAALRVDAPALLAMRLKVGERRQMRTQALLADGQAAVRALDLDAAARALRGAEAIAAQGDGVARLRERIFLARHYGHFEPGQVFAEKLAGGGNAPEMTVVPFGSFRMGEEEDRFPAEGPEHEVTFVRGFAIARNEVTVADFGRFVRATGYKSRASRDGHATVFDERGGSLAEHEGVDWRRDFLGRDAAEDRPVVHIAFEDAQAYAEWLSKQTGANYRLPSEAEWEYVLRAGRHTKYPWGDAVPPPKGVGNLSGEGDKSSVGRSWGTPIRGYTDFHWGTAPVRSFAPEPWRTYDMVGNVSEWVLDCWHDSYRRAPADGTAWINPGCKQRVVRGASWASAIEPARSSARLGADAASTAPWLGFRVVRDI